MNLKIRLFLFRQKLKIGPSAKLRANLWKNLSATWDAKCQVNYRWYQTPVFKWVAAGVAGVVLAGSFGTGAYAYVSPEVTEGTALYPLKQGLERVAEIVKINPEAKAKFLLKKLERREAEKKVLERRQQKIERLDERIKKIEKKFPVLTPDSSRGEGRNGIKGNGKKVNHN